MDDFFHPALGATRGKVFCEFSGHVLSAKCFLVAFPHEGELQDGSRVLLRDSLQPLFFDEAPFGEGADTAALVQDLRLSDVNFLFVELAQEVTVNQFMMQLALAHIRDTEVNVTTRHDALPGRRALLSLAMAISRGKGDAARAAEELASARAACAQAEAQALALQERVRELEAQLAGT